MHRNHATPLTLLTYSSHIHRSDSQEESDGSMHTDCCTTERRHTSLRHQLKLKCTVLDEMTPVYPHPPHTQPQSKKRLLVGTLTRNSTFQFGTDEDL